MVLILILAGGQADKPVQVIAAADLPGWIRSGAVRARLPKLQDGRLEDLFDGNTATAVRCGDEGRAVFIFTFTRPIPLRQVGITPGGGGVYRWQAAVPSKSGADTPDGFMPLFDWRYVESGLRDPFPVQKELRARSLRISVERLTLGEEIILHELECYTPLELKAIQVDQCPETVHVGSAFQPKAVAIDQFGGRLPLDKDVKLHLYPAGLMKNETGLLTPLMPGKLRLRFSMGTLSSEEKTVTITQAGDAPTPLQVHPFETTAAIHAAGINEASTSFALYVRRDGEPPPEKPRRISTSSIITVYGLEPGKAYHFSLAGLDGAGDPITPRSEALRAWTHAPGELPLSTIASIDLLIPIYTGEFKVGDMDSMTSGFERARQFIFRGSRARLNLDIQCLPLYHLAPKGAGPGMEKIAQELEAKGVHRYGCSAIHVATLSPRENCSGYRFQNGTIGSQGISAYAAWPAEGKWLKDFACWTLVHEFQHTLEAFVNEGALSGKMLSGHFLDNYPLPEGDFFDAGDFYDGQHEILKRFEDYLQLPASRAHRMEVIDQDGDGLPDDDPRLPMDEARFGSDPEKIDTDGDGLNDLDEYCAGLYKGSDPVSEDSDDDGVPDGVDPFPLSSFTGCIPFGTPSRGEAPSGLLARDVYFSKGGRVSGLELYASWDPNHLYLAVKSKKALKLFLHVDGSGHLGPFESDRRVQAEGGEDEAEAAAGDVYTGDRALTLSFGSPHLLCGGRVVSEAEVLSAEREGDRFLWAAVPARLGSGTTHCYIGAESRTSPGLTLEAGRVLGLAVTFRTLDSGADSGEEFGPGWGCIFETHRFYDAILLPPK
ncbi:MAG: hypothetical protein ACYTG7_08700 [Planctomycetota bacterium]